MERAPECHSACQYALDVGMWPEHQCVGECQYRVVRCGACSSEGRILRGQYEDEYDAGPCPACEGTGEEIVEVEPIDQDDLVAMSGHSEEEARADSLAKARDDQGTLDRMLAVMGIADSDHDPVEALEEVFAEVEAARSELATLREALAAAVTKRRA
jgi:hypothetical protein